MTAARLLAPALALMVGAVTALAGPAPPAAATDQGAARTPLTVHIDSLSRATIPRHGRLVVTGTVTNDSSETWQAINVQPLTSYQPITSRAALARAAATPADTYVGDRLAAPNTFESVGDLAPGEAARFRLSLPARVLNISGAPGVYWFGIHALGADAQGRDDVADGRARTFLPLVPRSTTPTQAALVVPLRAEVRRDPTGSLLDAASWTTNLAAGGLLEQQLSFVERARGVPLTWLVDPAVLQAADDLAHGNPALSYGEQTGTSPTPSPSPSAGSSPSGSASSPSPGAPSTSATPGTTAPDSGLPVTDPAALDWLNRLRTAMAGQSVLGLPFADPDVATLTHRGQALLHSARTLSQQTFHRFGIDDTPAVAPVDGVLKRASLPALRRHTLVLLSDRGEPVRNTHWQTPSGQDLVLTDQRAASGGPGPTPPLDALALRQRIVADAALRALHESQGPMVVTLPSEWDPGAAWGKARFFPTLEHVPWLQLTSVNPDPVAPTWRRPLPYPPSALHERIHEQNVAAARRLSRSGQTLASVLATDRQVADRVTGAALAAVSYHARQAPKVAREQVDAFNGTIHHTLSGISVTGTDFVTLSGTSGSLTVALVNDLQVPVTVDLRAHSDSRHVRIKTPGPVQIGAGQRTTIRLDASSTAVGVHQVRLTPVSESGQAVGTPLLFSLRSSDVGQWIWVIIGAGGLLLAVAILRRVVRRLLLERRG